MAADNPKYERFEDVDWEEVRSNSGPMLTFQSKGMLASMLVMAVLFVYDFFVVPENEATFESLGWGYNISQLDWLFAITLLAMIFYALVPMYQNPRLTRYYWKEFKKNRPAVISLVYLLVIFGIGVVGPMLIEKPTLTLLDQYQPPIGTSVDTAYTIQCVGEVSNGMCHGTWQYPLGTTSSGKDVLTIVVYGMQVSMKIGLISALLVLSIASFVGTLSAYAGGLVDEALMRYVDIQQVFPTFLLYLLIVYIWGGSLFIFILMFGLTSWGGTARYIRSHALQETEEEYIRSAKASGASTWRILRRHLVPNTASSIITDLTLLIPAFILAEAQLSFLGLGDPTIPSWGQLISSGRTDLSFAWWISTIPGIFLFWTILAFNFLGDALLDALNPEADTETEQ